MDAPSRAALRLASVVLVVGLSANAQSAFGQSFGVELFNTLMPASGGMGGTSIAQPQDALSAMHGNPAALSQFEGTRFEFSGAWAEPTVHIDQTGQIPAVGPPWSVRSHPPPTHPAQQWATSASRKISAHWAAPPQPVC